MSVAPQPAAERALPTGAAGDSRFTSGRDKAVGIVMRRRTRTLIGTVTMLAFVCLYGPLAMALADSRIAETPAAIQAVLYSILGIAWIFPLMPLIRWMERPDR
jgi:hypothetical protein